MYFQNGGSDYVGFLWGRIRPWVIFVRGTLIWVYFVHRPTKKPMFLLITLGGMRDIPVMCQFDMQLMY